MAPSRHREMVLLLGGADAALAHAAGAGWPLSGGRGREERSAALPARRGRRRH